MANVNLKDIRIAKSALTDTVYAGFVEKQGTCWRNKIDVTNDFLRAVVDRWHGCSQNIICPDGSTFTVTVKQVHGL